MAQTNIYTNTEKTLPLSENEPLIIVTGNEKGGAGKSTLCMHLCIALLRTGLSVGVIDLDIRQGTLTRYLKNRAHWARSTGSKLPLPIIAPVRSSQSRDLNRAEDEEAQAFQDAINHLKTSCRIILIDAPGGLTFYSKLAHRAADILITPLNDSFIDFDLLAEVDPQTLDVIQPSFYSEMVWQYRKERAGQNRRPLDWIVLRNRLSPLEARNTRNVGKALTSLSERIGFRLASGLSERVIYRELFPAGLTLLDVTEKNSRILFSMSHVAARQELRGLLTMLNLPELSGKDPAF